MAVLLLGVVLVGDVDVREVQALSLGLSWKTFFPSGVNSQIANGQCLTFDVVVALSLGLKLPSNHSPVSSSWCGATPSKTMWPFDTVVAMPRRIVRDSRRSRAEIIGILAWSDAPDSASIGDANRNALV